MRLQLVIKIPLNICNCFRSKQALVSNFPTIDRLPLIPREKGAARGPRGIKIRSPTGPPILLDRRRGERGGLPPSSSPRNRCKPREKTRSKRFGFFFPLFRIPPSRKAEQEMGVVAGGCECAGRVPSRAEEEEESCTTWPTSHHSAKMKSCLLAVLPEQKN